MADPYTIDPAVEARAAELARRPYARVIVPDEAGGYAASVLEFPGCLSDGETAEDALTNIEEALLAVIESMLVAGDPIPEPFDSQEFSGRVTLRIPPSLHARAARRAALERVSLNRLLSEAIAEHVGN